MNMQAAHSNSLGTSAVQRLRLTLAMAEHVERIGARIRAQRENLGLSRRKLAAEMAGVVTENDIYRWERGQHKPGDDKLEALAKALKVDVSYFMLPDAEPGTPDLMESLNGKGAQSQLDHIEWMLESLLRHFALPVSRDVMETLADEAIEGVDDSTESDAQAGGGSSGRSGAKRASAKARPRGKSTAAR